MRKKNIINYNNREFYSKTFIKKNGNKKPNALYYLSLDNARFTSIEPKKMDYRINKIKEKNKKLTNNTVDTKKERYIQKHKKNEKTYDHSYSNNYRFYSNNKKHSELNDTLNYKKIIINNKNDFSFSIIFNELFELKKDKINNYLKKSTNLSKNKVIKNEKNNNKRIKGRNNVSLNITDSWINFKNSIFNNNKNESKKQKIVPKKKINKNKINYSYSFVPNDLVKNSRKIENEKNRNFNISKNKRSLFRKENKKIISNFNNSKTKNLLKDNYITIENNFVKKVYKKDNAISSSKNKGKDKNKYKLNEKLTKKMKVFGNFNISSKPTVFSSYLNSEQNMMSSSLISNELIRQNKLNKNTNEDLPLNDNCILNYSNESNGKDIQDYESKFLNYELGLSDKISKSNFTLDNNDNCNKENIKNEYEKPVEEIEKIANQIINNSNYRNKTISIINKKLISTYNKISKEDFYNDDVEEFKKGETIQKVLNIYISQNNNNNNKS